MLSLGNTALEILSSLNCHQPMDDFQSYPHLWLLPCYLSLMCPLARLTATLGTEFMKTELSILSLCDITNCNLMACSFFRHHAMMTSFLICSIVIHTVCCPFSSRICLPSLSNHCCGLLVWWLDWSLLLYFLPLFPLTVILGLYSFRYLEQPPNLLCQTLSQYSKHPFFSDPSV